VGEQAGSYFCIVGHRATGATKQDPGRCVRSIKAGVILFNP
jgi:hypothetical protein